MASKRSRSVTPALPKNKKRKVGSKNKEKEQILVAENKFGVLQHRDEEEESASDSDLIFDYDGKDDEEGNGMVLIDSDDDDNEPEVIAISSDDDNEQEQTEDQNQSKEEETNENNDLAKNVDFIGFGFSSSEDEGGKEDNEEEDFSDDGIISADEGVDKYARAKSPSLYPWIKQHDHSKQREIVDWLTLEMKDFVNYISPSSEEITARNNVVGMLKSQISNFWPDTETHVFGSFATDLYLPGSDIDMVVVSRKGNVENRSSLYQLSSFLRNKGLAKNIEVIAKAKVPIIKFVDPLTNIHIDISFERTNGIDAARRIRKWLADTPGLREMVLIVKQFLRSRKLNNVHVGGLGGYATIILCYHFLNLHPKVSTKSISIMDNLGALLIEFFELYGRNFSFDNLIISLDPETDLPRYLKKSDYPYLDTSKNPFSIVIQDPADENNNITRSSFNLRDLKKAFGGAYQLLVDKCYRMHSSTYKERLGQSILGDIIKYKGKERDFNDDRHKVANHALLDSHQKDDAEESDGANGNDKYYFSDMTVESEDEIKIEKVEKVAKVEKVQHTKESATESTAKVANYLGIEETVEDDEDTKEEIVEVTSSKDENENTPSAEEMKKTKSNLDKDVRRAYWMQKGLEL
ncbi:topoisomerase I-related protein [Scheffersomyces amazonensis]|uniref:topoisomerase I-related protein n=1 Tax=Scheffersomyces amazonensis TaxID=1078765 RepID=UPI00315CE070